MNSMAKGCCVVVLVAGLLSLAAFMSHAAPHSKIPATAQEAHPLKPPATGKINVAFLISHNADVLDVAGSWEVFSDTMLKNDGKPWHESDGDDMVMPFNPYTVSDSLNPVDANGLIIVPSYSFDNAPKPQIIVIPAQAGRTAAQKAWLLANSAGAEVTMSVCTGAEVLAGYGFLDGQSATTHHMFQQGMQRQYPAVHFVSGIRFVENGKIATAGGVTSGIDLALHVVARYYGDEVAQVTANTLEYRSDLWKNPEYAQVKPVVAAAK